MGLLPIGFSFLAFYYSFSSYYENKPLRLWSSKRLYNFLATFTWGLGFFLIGLASYIGALQQMARFISGISWFLMIFAPCSTPIFNENIFLKIIRGILFASIGFSEFCKL